MRRTWRKSHGVSSWRLTGGASEASEEAKPTSESAARVLGDGTVAFIIKFVRRRPIALHCGSVHSSHSREAGIQHMSNRVEADPDEHESHESERAHEPGLYQAKYESEHDNDAPMAPNASILKESGGFVRGSQRAKGVAIDQNTIACF